jgi:RNA polymerase sigma-70 factor (ECF subfamily)
MGRRVVGQRPTATVSTDAGGRLDLLTADGMAGSDYAHMQTAGTPTDAAVALLARIAQGDREAFGRFYDAFAPLAMGLIRRILRDAAASEEVLQEVFWQIWQEAARYDSRRGSPEAWVVMRSKTRAIDRLRAMRRREKTFVAPVDESVTRSTEAPGENPGVAAETRGLVRSALDGLPESQRRVVELAFFEGLTQSEIASRLGEPLGTVKTRARLGLERLKGLIKREEPVKP